MVVEISLTKKGGEKKKKKNGKSRAVVVECELGGRSGAH